MKNFCCILFVLLFTCSSYAQETLMAKKGKLLFDDQAELERGKKPVKLSETWSVRAGAGHWEKKDGFYQSSWTQGHTPVMNFVGKYKNAIVEVTFRANKKDEKQSMQCFRIAMDNRDLYTGHVLSAWANPNNDFIETGFILQHISKEKDKTIIDDTIFDLQPLQFKEAEWQTAILEVVDSEALFQMGDNLAYAKSDKINVPKLQFSLTLGKTLHDIKRVRVWEASLKEDWAESKAKVLANRKPFEPQKHDYKK